MKTFYTLLIACLLSTASFGQIIWTFGNTASNLSAGSGSRSWNISGSNASATNLNNGNFRTDYLYVRGFDFSSLPANAVINTFVVYFTRNGQSTIVDSAVRLVVGGSVYYAPNTNAAASASTWSNSNAIGIYTFTPGSLTGVTAAQMKNANFGIAISARRTSGNNITANINTTVSILMSYTVVLPMILTDFTVSKNSDNQVDIRFSTASEENVDKIYIERSSDGKNFEKIFTVTPKGARNQYTKYAMTDKTPLSGSNYYRISQVDKDGKWNYYTTKLVNVTQRGNSFNAYYNGGQVVASVSSLPGQYEVSLVDMSGITISRKTLNLNNGAGQLTLDAPSRTGIYLVTFKGEGLNQAIRVAVTR